MRWFTENFLPGLDDEQRRDPTISPLYADLTACRPRSSRSGRPTRSSTTRSSWPPAGGGRQRRRSCASTTDGIHAFNAFPIGIADAANVAQIEFLRNAFAVRGGGERCGSQGLPSP